MKKIVTTSGRRTSMRVRPVALVAVIALLVAVVAVAVFRGSSRSGGIGADGGGDEVAHPSLPTRHEGESPNAGAQSTQVVSPSQTVNPVATAATNSVAPRKSHGRAADPEAWAEAESNRLAKSEAIMLAMAPKKHFDNDVENVLDSISRPGAQFLQMPFVDMSHDEVVAYLKKPVEFFDDDDEATVAAKERTAAVKAEALKFVEGGGTINQFIRDQVNAEKERQATTAEIRAEMRRILLSEGVDAAQAYLDEVNPFLEESGCQTVKIGRGEYNLLNRKERESKK